MDMTVNRLPSITWYWLKMNNGSLKDVDPAKEAQVQEEIPEFVSSVKEDFAELPEQPTGMGKDMTALLKESEGKALVIESEKNRKADRPVRLSLHYETGSRSANALYLKAQRGSEITVVEDFSSAGNSAAAGEDTLPAANRKAEGSFPAADGSRLTAGGNAEAGSHAPEKAAESFAAVQTRFLVEEGAVLKLIQIQRLDDSFTFLNDIGGQVQDGGRIEMIHLVLDGGHTYLGVETDLTGFRSALKADIGYRVGGDGTLDVNYFANHTGRKSTSEIDAKGVLREKAYKVFRGTIDLKKGASGSEGNEKEDVLMMDDTVHNQTLPVILCTEEDVVGNHGATIGRLDENELFYLESRGIDKESVYEMMADARVASVVHLIEDDRTRGDVEKYLARDLDRDLE